MLNRLATQEVLNVRLIHLAHSTFCFELDFSFLNLIEFADFSPLLQSLQQIAVEVNAQCVLSA